MKKTLFILSFLILGLGITNAQTTKITGTVVDETGETVIGATIVVKGNAKVGTTTNIDGKFSLNLPESSKKLIVSYLGMKAQEVDAKPVMKIKLVADSKQLNEVVVTGMVKIDKRLFTGATNKLDAAKTKLDGIPDVSRALEGRSAGVSVQNVSGTFGTAPKIRVRGATSIYGSSKPLWVVDGIVVENITDVSADDLSSGDAITLVSSAVAGLNADDIENFQILKDGSATSIYGARAMAGVIVITTKKGKSGVSSINYTGEYTMRLTPSYNEFNIMNSQDQMGIYTEMSDKGWLTFADVYRAKESGVYGKMYHLMNTYDPATKLFALANTPEARNMYLKEAEMRNSDWFAKLFQTNIMQNHSISISSGNDKTSFYSSLSALTDAGWTKQSSVSRYTANFNVTHNILKNLTLNLISNGSYRSQRAPGTLSQDVDVVSGEVKRDFDINPYSYALNTSRAMDVNTYYTRNYSNFNILNELDNNYMDFNVVDLKFQGELKWKLLKNLEFGVLGSLNYKTTSQEHFIKEASNQVLAYKAGIDPEDNTIRDANPYLYRDPQNLYALPISVLPFGGIYKKNDYKMKSVDFRSTVSWSQDFNEDHIVNFFGGMETNATERNSTSFDGWGLQYENGEIPFYVYQFLKKGIEDGNAYYSLNNTRKRSVAYFGSLTYSYKGKYSLNITSRDEGSNLYTGAARWLPTWNYGLSWNVSDEKYFQPLKPAISHLSARASYSLTASPVPDFITNSNVVIKSYNPYRPFSDVKESGLQIVSLQNEDLTYEKKNEINLGADLGILDNRINISFDWYTRDNYDLIGPINTPGAGGETIKFANVANMKTGGVEFSLTTKNIVSKDFSWSSDFIFGKNKTEVTKLDMQSNIIDLISGSGFAKQGFPNRALFSIPFAGLDESGIPTFYNADGSKSTAKDAYIDFQNRTNLDYLKYEGPTDPTINGSFGNIFNYKSFKLNVFITYSFGNVVRLDPVFSSEYSDLNSMTKDFKNRWMIPGDEYFTSVPTILSKRQLNENTDLIKAYNAYNYSDVRIADGGFVRLKEISLAYDIPKKSLLKEMSNLSIKFQATNLALLYADKKLNGQDPEFFRSGGVSTPVPKQFTLTLRASF
jgi:TonB-linked SusC/RagA family outer membrane protein